MAKIDPQQIDLLKNELHRRVSRNPRYSLRSFAKSLGLSHTALSLALGGKRPLSKKASLQIAERLGLDPAAAAAFVTGEGEDRKKRLQKGFRKIDLETFSVISDWVHFAILSLLEIPGAKFEAKWIGRRLGVGELAAKMAMGRLQELGLVARVNGRWRQSGDPIRIDNTISTAATRRFHREALEKAIASLENDPAEVRAFSSMTLNLDPAQLPYARERIKEFRRELTAELESRGSPREVYNLTFQVYPLSRNSNPET